MLKYPTHILAQSIWLNENLKIDNTTVFFLILIDVTKQYFFYKLFT
jgi:hypothetical protein